MRLTPEARVEYMRSMEQMAARHAKIQAALEAAAPALSANLKDLHPQKYGKRRWEVATLEAIYGNDSLTQ